MRLSLKPSTAKKMSLNYKRKEIKIYKIWQEGKNSLYENKQYLCSNPRQLILKETKREGLQEQDEQKGKKDFFFFYNSGRKIHAELSDDTEN
jgi:hypothetical protein